MRRPRVTAFLACSIDGYIAGPGDSLDFLRPYTVPDDDLGYGALFASADAMLIGRRTWETVCTFETWPYAGKRVLVRTHRPLEATHGEEKVQGSISEILAGLQDLTHVYVDGGRTVRDALAEGVVDRLTLTLVPEIVGGGVPLFETALPASTWTRAAVRTREDGTVQVTWRRAEPAAPTAR